MEITRRSVLSDALQYRQSLVRKFSRDSRGLVARTGYQEEFARYSEECRILRELMQALEYEKVRAAMAEFLGKDEAEEPELKDWQLEVLQGGKQTVLFRYVPICCIQCFELGKRFSKAGIFEGYICRRNTELFGDYEKCNAGRMEGCPIYGHTNKNEPDHPAGRDVSGREDTVQR